MKYRSEIDGLRAVAVLPVIFFHAGFVPFQGGVVGVDVFFVISGYLITSLILEEIRTDSFSLAGFYDRRARRILPALFFLVVCSVPIAWVTLLPKDLTEFFHSVSAVSLFSSNFLFWFQSGYFDTGAELKPLLHTWSLAVEEQFYIIFPLLLMALWRFGRKAVLWILFGLFVVSLSYADWSAYNDPSTGFFLLPSRGWELLIGAFAAFYLQGRDLAPANALNNFLSVVGFLAIAFSIVNFSEHTPFPSIFALVPTIGTVLIILFAVPGTWVHRFLSLRACVGIGLISYSMYLWHQPLFVFARYLFGLPVGSYTFLALTIVATLLAFFSWRYVERPFRRKGFAVNRVLSTAAVASIVILALGYLLPKMDVRDFDELDNKTHRRGWTTCYPFGTREEAGGSCDVLNPNAAPTIAVIGDSHAVHLASGLREMYGGSQENPIVLVSGGCYPVITKGKEFDLFMQCEKDFIDKSITYVLENAEIRKVILSGYGNLQLRRRGAHIPDVFTQTEITIRQAMLLEGMKETVGMLLAADKKVMLIADNPEMIEHPAHCSTRAAGWFGNCPHSIAKSDVDDRHKELDQIIKDLQDSYTRLQVFDPRSVFCDEENCYSGSQNENWYRDRNHFTPAGSIRLVDEAVRGF